MAEVLAASLAFPTVIYTVVLALALLYWLFVVVGAVDADHLAGDHLAGDHLAGASKGALEGAAKGALEGVAKGAAGGAAEGAEGAVSDHPSLPAIVAALRFDRAPATVVLSFFATFGWLVSVLATITLGSGAPLPRGLFGALVLVLSALIALPLTSLAIRPLAPLFATKVASARGDLVGRVALISTGRVDGRFGQATLEDGGSGFILDVRCDTEGALRRGDRALLVSWDPERNAFAVEPLDDLLPAAGAEKLHVSAGSPADLTASGAPGAPGTPSDGEDAATEGEATEARRRVG